MRLFKLMFRVLQSGAARRGESWRIHSRKLTSTAGETVPIPPLNSLLYIGSADGLFTAPFPLTSVEVVSYALQTPEEIHEIDCFPS